MGELVEKILGDFKVRENAHAYLFYGPKNEAKLLSARRIAEEVLEDRNSLDLVEIGGKGKIKVEEIRKVIDFVSLGRRDNYQVVIVNGVEEMTREAVNCFLKTLEEPPGEVVFFLVCDDLKGVLPTVVSRCRKVFFAESKPSLSDDYLELVEAFLERDYVNFWRVVDDKHGDVLFVKGFLNDLKLRMYEEKKDRQFALKIGEYLEMVDRNVNSRLVLENLMLEF